MTDRELLEYAAKAAGYAVAFDVTESIAGRWLPSCGEVRIFWNPLNEDGDALRLAVDTNITFRNFGHIMSAVGSSGQFNEYADSDAYAATRRAIVRAAAEIGRAMK